MGEEQTVTGTKSVTRSITRTLAAILIVAFASGCEVNSWLGDPSKTGYFEFTPTMIPVLERLDVIERHTDLWGETTGVLPEDLMPGELSYRISPGDLITVGIFELYVQGQWTTSSRQVSASGEFRIPELGEVQAAGLTAQEFEDRIIKLLEEIASANNHRLIFLVRGTDGSVNTLNRARAVVNAFNQSNSSEIIPGRLPLPGEGKVDLNMFAKFLKP